MTVRPLLCFVAALLTLPPSAIGQIRASERGWVGQRVDGTNLTVAYGRPRARGRTLFGGVVPHGEVWTPGANWASTFDTDRDVTVEGVAVAAGAYSMWLVTAAGPHWTLYLHRESRRFHTDHPEIEDMAVAIPVQAEEGEHHEALTFHFPEFRRDGTTLHFHWGTTQVAMEIGVRPSMAGILTAEEIAPYLGSYDVEMFGGPEPYAFSVELIDAAGRLRGIADEGEWAFQLVPSSDEEGTFFFAFLQDGEIVDVEEGGVRFNWEDGAVTGYTVYGIGIDVWMEAVKR